MGFNKWLRGVRRDFGVIPLCNGKPKRAPHIGSFCLPLCWRCTSVVGSTIVCSALHLVAPIDYFKWGSGVLGAGTVFFTLPMLWDGWIQYGRKLESTNLRRIITGALCGIGLWFGSNLLLLVLE
ncbi:DUF2085 domain-containing protein [Paenibacillus sp. FSL R5-0914]|uniref:DUF2085 domain-containing protein n=1 Tax=Paenibacillus sp. FSL R5-0914 TaxID=2921665 RepID=UPI0030FC15FF